MVTFFVWVHVKHGKVFETSGFSKHVIYPTCYSLFDSWESSACFCLCGLQRGLAATSAEAFPSLAGAGGISRGGRHQIHDNRSIYYMSRMYSLPAWISRRSPDRLSVSSRAALSSRWRYPAAVTPLVQQPLAVQYRAPPRRGSTCRDSARPGPAGKQLLSGQEGCGEGQPEVRHSQCGPRQSPSWRGFPWHGSEKARGEWLRYFYQ